MRCRKIQDLIVTDYSDNEISPENKNLVEEHLANCSRCREYKTILTKFAIEPFRKIRTSKPSDSVWRRIKEAIEPENRFSLAPKFFYIPRPVFALATAMVLVLFLGIFAKAYINKQEIARLHSQEQVEYLTSLFRGNDYVSNSEGMSYGTAIEEYFL